MMTGVSEAVLGEGKFTAYAPELVSTILAIKSSSLGEEGLEEVAVGAPACAGVGTAAELADGVAAEVLDALPLASPEAAMS